MNGKQKLQQDVKYNIEETKDQDCQFNENGCKNTNKKCLHKYCDKYLWIIERAEHYAEKTGLSAEDILNGWENQRNCWYMNFYQEGAQPKVDSGTIKVFENEEELLESAGKEFRCPLCKGITKNPYECDTGIISKNKTCDWKAGGLFTIGLSYVFLKKTCQIHSFFTPIKWE